MDSKILTFKHSCFSGDLIYALASIKALCEKEGDQAIIYQWLDQEAYLYPGAEHPYGGKMMNQYAFDMMKPLLDAQPYVKEFRVWQGEKVHIDLDQFRYVKNHMPFGNIVLWPTFVAPEMRPRYWEPWIEKSAGLGYPGNNIQEKIIINRTSRYHQHWVHYFCLKEYADRMLFVGTLKEHQDFCKEWGFDVMYLKVENFFGLAEAIANCKLFIGNQSMCFAIAEAMKTPRLLEVCDACPNVMPAGDNGYCFRAQEPFEFLLKQLL